jgi:hypothetical protein
MDETGSLVNPVCEDSKQRPLRNSGNLPVANLRFSMTKLPSSGVHPSYPIHIATCFRHILLRDTIISYWQILAVRLATLFLEVVRSPLTFACYPSCSPCYPIIHLSNTIEVITDLRRIS